VDFVAKNSNKLQKFGSGRKNQLSPHCVHTWANYVGHIGALCEQTIMHCVNWVIDGSLHVTWFDDFNAK
jgi:hypothetical protein